MPVADWPSFASVIVETESVVTTTARPLTSPAQKGIVGAATLNWTSPEGKKNGVLGEFSGSVSAQGFVSDEGRLFRKNSCHCNGTASV